MTPYAQSVDELFGACDVPACSPKRFRKSAHKDIDGARGDVEVITDATAMRSNGPDRVSFVDEKEELNNVLAISQNLGQLRSLCISSSVP